MNFRKVCFFLKSIFVLHDALQDSGCLEKIAGGQGGCGQNGENGMQNNAGEGVILLVVADRGALASGFEGHLEQLQSRAQSLKGMLASRGVRCEVMLEWGEKNAVAHACAQRENAVILNA